MENKYEGFKIIKLDYEYDTQNNKSLDSWSKVGQRDPYKCPECYYLGRKCDRCRGDF